MTTKSLGGLDVQNPMDEHVSVFITSINSSNVPKTHQYMNFYGVIRELASHSTKQSPFAYCL